MAACVAAGAAAIAYQQCKVNHRKLKLDQYDRRMKIYSELKTLLGIIIGRGKATSQELLEFRGKGGWSVWFRRGVRNPAYSRPTLPGTP